MRQLGRAFLSLWIAVFGPSVVVWLLWIRGSDSGLDRFERTWHLLEDKLAYPLVFTPLTDWGWTALRDSNAVAAVVAFILLVALWALVITLPIIFVAFCWVVLAQFTSSSASAGLVAGSSLGAPSGALYLVTVPLALVWAGIRWVVVPDPAGERPVRRFFSPIGKPVPFWSIRRMKTKWGSCNPDTGNIWFNLELAKKEPRCVEYVVVHEMAHLLERGHGDRFVELMDRLMPDWRQRRDALNAAPLAHEEWPS